METKRPNHEQRIVVEISYKEKLALIKKCEKNGWTIRYVIRKLLNEWLESK